MPSSCWAPNCSNRLSKGCPVKMYRFPQSNAERLNRWIVKIARLPRVGQISKRADGLHEPKEHDRLCSDHFVKGKPSNDPNDIDYVPSIFMTNSKKNANPHKQKSSHENQSQYNRSCEKQAAMVDSTTDEFASYRHDEQEAAIGMLLLQESNFPSAEANCQKNTKLKRTLKVVQLNNLVNKPNAAELNTRYKDREADG